MTTLLRLWRTYGKAHVAFVGAVLTWAATTYPDTPLGRYAGIVVAVLTAAGVVAAPHRSKAASRGGTTSVGTVTVQVEADIEHLLEQIAGSLHSAGDAVSAAKPKPKAPAKKA